MSHEIFVIDRKSTLDEQEQSHVTYLCDKLSTAEGLGLKAQACSIKVDLATVERGRLITTPPMTNTELIIWQAWLPTIYSDVTDDNRHQLANYHFDRVPSPVLKMWQKHKESGAFERFEIWTPENPRPDPILVGVNGNARHLLARWGESDADLVSFDDIKRELVRRWHKSERIGGESFEEDFERREDRAFKASMSAAIASFVSVFVGQILTVLIGIKGNDGGVFVAIFILLSAASTFIYIRRRLTKKLWASSTLMQAIIKDNSRPRELLLTPA